MKDTKKGGKSALNEEAVDYNSLNGKLNSEEIAKAVKQMLGEQVRETYARLLNEEDDEDEKEYDVEEVEDTTDTTDGQEDTVEAQGTDDGDAADDGAEGTEPGEGTEDAEEVEDAALEGDDEEGAEDEFEKFKVGEGEYDFRNAEDDDVVKVFKRLKDDDGVTVEMNGDKVTVNDSETGAEYIITMNGGASEGNKENIEISDMTNESRIYEIALNEYDSNVGYTDNYQKKDVMTGDGVKEPGNGRDIDKGVPHDTKKPWSGKKDSAAAPFNAEKGKTVEENAEQECGDVAQMLNDAPEMEESIHTQTQNGPQRRSTTISQVPNTSRSKEIGRNRRTAQDGQVSGTGEAAYQGVSESIIKKAKKVFSENKKLKKQLDEVTKVLQEAALVNTNLGGIVKIITENSTSSQEKKDIISRFTNEAHTIQESKNLYERITNELSKKPEVKADINEEINLGGSPKEVISESKFYQDDQLMHSLGLMHNICK
jgi:hypothetical protein